MKRRLILLIDFSEYSVQLIKYANTLARYTNAVLLLVHQNTFLTPGLSDIESKANIISKSNEDAIERLKEMARTHVHESINLSILVNDIPLQFTINHLIKEEYENLIFLGLKGTGFFKQVFIGSMALQLIEKTENIMIALPSGIDVFSQERIYVYVSESNPINLIELNNFLKFIHNEHAQLIFITVTNSKLLLRETERKMLELVALFEHRFKTGYRVYQSDNALDEIKKVINNKIDEILVVQKKNRIFTDYFLKTNIMNELVTEGKTPLVILP
ncbi:MAG TPA: universal stress protein [Edaphocola sp.]|nr:universal stress protein [Edaphocola sp.]